ncbi:MAG: hypothetical protein QX189_18860 [Methylococcales bacterium]
MSETMRNGHGNMDNHLLIEDLKRTKDFNIIYIAHYFFAYDNGDELLFYYNPNYFWSKVSKNKVLEYVFDNLRNECAVLSQFNPDVSESSLKPFDNWISHKPFFPETPTIGNHYSCLGSRVVSHHRYFYLLGNYGGCLKQQTKNITADDFRALLYWAVMTNTPRHIKSIYDLKCFNP